ncbi:MAG: NAD(P)/FAD-dependent oxidoreductase [Pleomorphochaeta sp.]
MNIIIIGNGPAGNTLASKLDSKGYKVEVYSNEDVSFYSRIRLPSCLGNLEKLDSLCSKNEPSYINHESVVAIHRESKSILLSNGEAKHYDKLVLATGSNPLDFFSHTKLDGIFTLRTYLDAKKITEQIESPVCIVGGGLLGLESALELNALSHDITVIQGEPYVLNRQLNEEAAKIVEDKCLQRDNFKIICNHFVDSVNGNKRIEKVILDDNREIKCNSLLMAAGVKPSVALAKACNLDVARAITINEYCQTSDMNIYAIGDCAEYKGQCPGLLPIALATANTAFNHIIGEKVSYVAPSSLPTRFQADDLSVASFGVLEGECHSKQVEDRYEAWYIKDKKVVGVIIVGSKSHLPLAKASLNKEVDNIDVLLDF